MLVYPQSVLIRLVLSRTRSLIALGENGEPASEGRLFPPSGTCKESALYVTGHLEWTSGIVNALRPVLRGRTNSCSALGVDLDTSVIEENISFLDRNQSDIAHSENSSGLLELDQAFIDSPVSFHSDHHSLGPDLTPPAVQTFVVCAQELSNLSEHEMPYQNCISEIHERDGRLLGDVVNFSTFRLTNEQIKALSSSQKFRCIPEFVPYVVGPHPEQASIEAANSLCTYIELTMG